MRTHDLRYSTLQQKGNTMNAVFSNDRQSRPDFGFNRQVHKHTS